MPWRAADADLRITTLSLSSVPTPKCLPISQHVGAAKSVESVWDQRYKSGKALLISAKKVFMHLGTKYQAFPWWKMKVEARKEQVFPEVHSVGPCEGRAANAGSCTQHSAAEEQCPSAP